MHVATQFDYMTYGVAIARRGWAEKKDVLNTLPYPELLRHLKAVMRNKSKNYSTG
jgi:DNA polymerase (family 10)